MRMKPHRPTRHCPVRSRANPKPTPEPQTQVKAQVDPKKVNVEELARAQILMDGARERMDAAMIQPFLLHEDPRIRARAAHYLGRRAPRAGGRAREARLATFQATVVHAILTGLVVH